MEKFRAWLVQRIAELEECAARHRGVGVYHDHVTTWQAKVAAFREALAELERT